MAISEELARRVCPCAADVAGRVYPLAVDERAGDDAMTVALVQDVADVLTGYGFPVIEPDSPDWYALSWCVWRYLYGHTFRGRHALDPGDASDERGGSGGAGPAGGEVE